MLKNLVLVLMTICCFQAKAQIPAPDLMCVRNDSLFWNLPNVSCGTVQSYNIYVSTDQIDGPFTLLTTITDINQTVFHFNNPGNLVAYFYMETVADCPGQTALTSNVLDNQKPPSIPIEALSIENGIVEIRWDNISDVDVVGYVIYKVTSSGTVAIDTVNGTPYLDVNADPENNIETYYVNALDQCGEISFFDEPHNIIKVESSINSCAQSVDLTWNAYNSWPNGVERYIIYVDTNGTGSIPVDTVAGNVLNYSLQKLLKNVDYTVYIQAQTENGTVFSNSTVNNFEADVVAAVDPFELLNVDVIGPNSIKLYWYWEGDFNIGALRLKYVLPNRIDTTTLVLNPVIEGDLYTYTLQGVETSEQLYFVLEVQNNCELLFRSNGMYSIKLAGASANNAANLEWMHSNAQSNGLELYRVGDSSQIFVGFFPLGQNATQDVWDGSAFQYCYLLIDTIVSPFTFDVLLQHSNILCLSESLEVYVPSAFAPKGTNREFLAYYSNASIIDTYEMKIFDRLGNKLFESKSHLRGWNGYVNETLCNPGLYAYSIVLTTVTGEKIERSGAVNLID